MNLSKRSNAGNKTTLLQISTSITSSVININTATVLLEAHQVTRIFQYTNIMVARLTEYQEQDLKQ